MSKKKTKKVEETPVSGFDEKPTIADKGTREIVKRQLAKKVKNKHNATTLDEILGEKLNPYEQRTEAEYEEFIQNLNFTDLERHATEVGVPPRRDREDMEKYLMRQFNLVSSSYYNTRQERPAKAKISKRVLDILSEGR